MKQLRKKFEECLDNYNIKKKLRILYIFCVLLPLILTDSVIIYIVIHSEQDSRQHEMENIASAVQYSFIDNISNMERTANNVYTNKYIDEFLEQEYESPLEYVRAYQSIFKDTLLKSGFGIDSTRITIYADNKTIISGGEFDRISSIKDTEWYDYIENTGRDKILFAYYDTSKSPAVDAERKIIYVRKLKFFNSSKDKLIRVELDYSKLARDLLKMSYGMPIYICKGNQILFSNNGHTSIIKDFDLFTRHDRVGYKKDISLYGADLNIYILKPNISVLDEMKKNLPILFLLLFVNIVLPLILMKQINRSFSVRLRELSEVFERVEDEKLAQIKTVRGIDEIGSLMRNYNRMAVRTNDLMQTVYRDKLREQEINIARQNAELLALHSQINPHFMFNALESIRMHSILKKEYETADMVEKLAIMERKNVDWGNDFVEISKEVEFVRAYLEIQKYRFGERLSYQLDVAENCINNKIPKLTLVTFVENACVHGIESKTTPGWIFVRAYREKENLCLEIEDTGSGMDEKFMEELRDKMEHASIDLLKEKGRVGILNACLRLKMVTSNEVSFELDGEKGMGTIVQIRIPLSYV